MIIVITDGWRTIGGYDVYVEDECVKRGKQRAKNGFGFEPIYPYRKNKRGGWDLCEDLSVSAFRAGVERGTIIMK